jgi:hypothetical protein
MTLDEWVGLSASERNALRRDWSRDEGSWLELLHEACARFEAEYGGHRLINAIGGSAWQAPIYEPSIWVTTALFSPQLIEELPDRYLMFRVVQHQIDDNKQAYLRTWTLVLGQPLGWSEKRVLAWARKYHEHGLDGRDRGWFYHEDEYYCILDFLVPTSVRKKLSFKELAKLEGRLKTAIAQHGSSPLWLSPYDWDAARERINTILGEYGAALPRVRRR